jgi:hypothetical protein
MHPLHPGQLKAVLISHLMGRYEHRAYIIEIDQVVEYERGLVET